MKDTLLLKEYERVKNMNKDLLTVMGKIYIQSITSLTKKSEELKMAIFVLKHLLIKIRPIKTAHRTNLLMVK